MFELCHSLPKLLRGSDFVHYLPRWLSLGWILLSFKYRHHLRPRDLFGLDDVWRRG